MSSAAPDVVVVGAGVIGLTTAVCLAERGLAVEVRAALPPRKTTSAAAAGTLGLPDSPPNTLIGRWERAGHTHFRALANEDGTGVGIGRGKLVAREGEIDQVPVTGERCAPGELPDGFAVGYWRTGPVVDMVTYLEYLEQRLAASGGRIELALVESLRAIADEVPLLVNCTGIGARELVGDETVVPIRGQHVIVENPGLDYYFVEWTARGEFAAYWPYPNHVVLGGVFAVGDDRLEPDAELAKRIVARCAEMEPRLRDARVLGHRVGLRPARPEPRLEAEQIGSARCVHSYGHGSSGITYSWGAATDAVDLLLDGSR